MVFHSFQNNYGGDSKSLSQTRFLFWFVVPSRFRLRQMATPLGTLESQAI